MTLKKDANKHSKKNNKKSQTTTNENPGPEHFEKSSSENTHKRDETGSSTSASLTSVDDSEAVKNEEDPRHGVVYGSSTSSGGSGNPKKLDRKPSLRRKFGALIRGSAELPAAINRGLQPIRRSLSFSKDLNRVYETQPASADRHHARTRSAQWYNSLGSLAENSKDEEDDSTHNATNNYNNNNNNNKNKLKKHNNEDDNSAIVNVRNSEVDDDDDDDDDDERFGREKLGGRIVARTHSLLDKDFAPSHRRRTHTVSGNVALFGRHSDHYDSAIDLSKPPFEAISLPVLTHSSIDEDESGSRQRREHRVWNGWGNLRASARNLSLLRLGSSFTRERSSYSVRSRSLSQLDALGTSMLDTGEHRLVTGATSPHQTPQQQHQQTQNRFLSHHQNQQHYIPPPGECSPRFLVPSSASIDGSHTNRHRHKLSRSQVSSSEYFSVSFEVGDESGSLEREEFLPATKGTFLVEALGGACERRGVDLGRVDVLLEAFSNPLPILTTETSCLGGKHLRITAKDEKLASRSASQRSNQNVSLRKTSGSYRGRSGRFFSVSTEDSSVDSEIGTAAALASSKTSAGTAGLKASKQRWSGFFTNTKGTKMELLVEQLNGYTKHGVPRLPEIQLPYDFTTNEEALYGLEDDWRDIVENSDRLTEKQQQQQTALWELAQTEAAYIRTLKVVTDLFMACLCSLQASNILNEVDRTRLFSNIPDIYAANRFFWSEHILGMINVAKSSGNPLDPGHLLHGFETFEQTFAPYTRYCSEQSKCQQYCRERLNDNELFTAYLVWCETQKDCNRLRLLDILVKPMQRLTKYSLLLKAVHKNTENEEQRVELTMMIKCVDSFVASVNAALRRTEETARLASAALRIESYDVVESRDEELEKLVKIHSSLDITTAPMPGCPKDTLRTLIREGDLKLRDAATSKSEVHVLLLTDMLLLCKTSTKKASGSSSSGTGLGGLKVIRQPYVVDRIRIHELKEPTSVGLVYLNEYGAASGAFVLSASEPKLAKSWMESLRKAQQQFAIMKLPPVGGIPPIAAVSRQASTYLGDGDYEMEECDVLPRTPRGSSRASRVSSLAHSHSGSMEMEGVSPGSSNFVPSYNASRNVSVETSEPPRASSVSSEEGGEVGAGHNHRPLQIRRSLLSKSPTPNTLSVQVPAYSSLGQSLPNLTLATSPQTSTVSPTPPNSLLIVPQITKSKDTLLSPGHRGISYPPPSPPRGALRRAFAIPQSRNPPLIKTRHVNASVTQTAIQATLSLDADAIEERRRRLEPSQRPSPTGIIAKEEKRHEENR
ncbi:pleckstrin homology domain-containing family G member 5 [Venturia canescens]|uniref:pleckstrin homology domain-containing family G member 5 n=1 Tax=Venturia canescens TaxID=32260 RepID=UPI001C9CEEC4|nr:pleckstrin homology domain-containing family G member 5-like [Venturia canescens]XP_043290108.1 pleckstrin homology domain-containing family G member 5-like [Venturia canescens]XP_043290109.1 pleckstrin homology domain-containing family G member 5-like [Venturia canescens]XP_043290110.1 pleckstrin homology domain-containing family G member 5-like [Venturia canescens]XP_043290111.1 pleckstrin homology domain-containing family G member 5-like [Venturia canescens]XP_043290112.1 pleckstrin homo